MQNIQPQQLNVPILELARGAGSLRDGELHWKLALSCGACGAGCLATQPGAAWRFSAVVNLAKRRLLRYGLIRSGDDGRLGITPLGELFLCRGLRRLDPKTRRSLAQRHRAAV